MIAVRIGQHEDHTKKRREILSVKTQGGQIYRDTLGQQFAVFIERPSQLASTATLLELPQIPADWLKLS